MSEEPIVTIVEEIPVSTSKSMPEPKPAPAPVPVPVPKSEPIETYETPKEILTEDITVATKNPIIAFTTFGYDISWFQILIAIIIIAIIFLISAVWTSIDGKTGGAVTSWLLGTVFGAGAVALWYYKVK